MRILKNKSLFSINGINYQVNKSHDSVYKWTFLEKDSEQNKTSLQYIYNEIQFKDCIYINSLNQIWFKTLPDIVSFLNDFMAPTIKLGIKNTSECKSIINTKDIVGYKIKNRDWIELFEEITDIKYEEVNDIAFNINSHEYQIFNKLKVLDVIFTPVYKKYVFKGKVNDLVIYSDNINCIYIFSWVELINYLKFKLYKPEQNEFNDKEININNSINESFLQKQIRYDILTPENILDIGYTEFEDFISSESIIFLSSDVLEIINK